MRTFLMMKIYAAVALAILGVRLAFAFLNYIELVQFFGSAIGISLLATLLHKYFENKAHKTGKNAVTNSSFLIQMIIITVLASTGTYLLISYVSSGELSIGFEIFFYIAFIPAVVLISIWMYFKIIEEEYNNKLKELKEKR